MKILIDLKKRFLSRKYQVNINIDCSCKAEAESIEVSFVKMLGQIRSYDFENDEDFEEHAGVEEEPTERKIGFDDYVVGEDDGRVPFDDEEEYEDEE